MAGFTAALRLTRVLFVALEAYVAPSVQGQAKMHALLSGGVGLVAVAMGRSFGFRGSAPRDKSPISPRVEGFGRGLTPVGSLRTGPRHLYDAESGCPRG